MANNIDLRGQEAEEITYDLGLDGDRDRASPLGIGASGSNRRESLFQLVIGVAEHGLPICIRAEASCSLPRVVQCGLHLGEILDVERARCSLSASVFAFPSMTAQITPRVTPCSVP
jgi:hypothetical protein